jgi:hypothetical protein
VYKASMKSQKPLRKRWWVWVVAIIFVGAIASACKEEKQVSTTNSPQTQESVKNTDNKKADTSQQVDALKKYLYENFGGNGDNQ